jgi:subtilisin family serine protease
VPPRELCRRFSPVVALPAILALSALAIVVVARTAAHPTTGYTKLLVAADRRGETRAVERKVETLSGRSVQLIGGPDLLAVRVRRSDAHALSRRLARIRGVRFVERNRALMRTTGSNWVQALPTDPLWRNQWGPADIGAPAAWAVTTGSPRIVIAMVDTGVDASQPDLRGALVPGYDFVNGDNDPSDDNGHGTRTAGIAGARADNGLGISGVCPRCSIMPVKVTGANGTATWLNVASGIAWAADHGASVISMSLGGGPSDAVAQAIRYAQSKGVLVVAAAGNGGSSQPFYPAADPGVLSVGATQKTGKLYSWSNYGSWVDVAAPGCDTTTFVGDGFGQFCGTSASAPLVAGLAGLAFSYSPTSSAETIEHAIVSSAYHLDGVTDGRVDAVGTLAALGAKFRVKPARRSRTRARLTSARSASGKVRRVPHARVTRGGLRTRWHVRLTVLGGRVAATLHSPKAQSCYLSLRSGDGLWLSSNRGPTADALVARLAGGKYHLNVQCMTSRPRPASLTVRGARVPKHQPSSRHRGWRGAPVPVALRFKPL